MILGLTLILILVLFLPFSLPVVEENLEAFLFTMGIAAAAISHVLDKSLMIKALEDPIHIALAVLLAGLLFRWLQTPIERGILTMSRLIPFRIFLAFVVIILGLISSVITAIIAAIILVVIVSVIKLDRKSEIQLVILACYSIGLGAVLTPIGEPLSTIAVKKLDKGFFYLFNLIGIEIIIGVIIFGLLAGFLIAPHKDKKGLGSSLNVESYIEIFIRAIKIYVFVMGLTLLGAGFEPLIERYLLSLSPYLLYWINIISAVLDNATLAAAEITPAMDEETIKAILLGLLISGGMLIQGNIPNIISASKLQITSKEWAKFGFPIGLSVMIVYFVVLLMTS